MPSKRKEFPISNTKAVKIFDLVHMDIRGPISIPSTFGHRYFLTIVDDHSRHTWLYLMKLKSETSTHIHSFIEMIETQFSTKLKCIRFDNGPEFKLNHLYSSKGIIHQTSCVEAPQQNVVGRKHQHILNTARALMFQSNAPKCLWNYAVKHAL